MGGVAFRRKLPELLLAAGATLAFVGALALLEVVLRTMDARYLDRTREPTVYSERYGWRYRPGARATMHGVWTSINSRGYRGREHALEKTPGRTRVVMLGDSVLFGPQVPEGLTFASLLGSRTGRYDVINLGVEGYGTDQELLLLADEGLAYAPDVVGLSFFIDNDVRGNSLSWDQARFPKPYFTLEGEKLRLHDEHLRLTPLERLAQWLQDYSHAYGRIYPLLPESRGRRRAPDPQLRPHEAREVTVHLIHRMDEMALGAGARFVLLLHPNEPALARPSSISRRFRRAPLLAGVPILDLAERYRARGLEPKDVLLDYQGHLSRLGHLITVQEIETWLATLDDRPDPGPPHVGSAPAGDEARDRSE